MREIVPQCLTEAALHGRRKNNVTEEKKENFIKMKSHSDLKQIDVSAAFGQMHPCSLATLPMTDVTTKQSRFTLEMA